MKRVVWSSRAEDDLEAIYAYLLDRNPVAARRIVARVMTVGTRLARFPGAGRPGAMETREFSVPPYILVYEVTEASVVVLRIWHSAQNR